MGATQKLIDFSKRRAYKITVIGLVAVAVLFILIGAILAINSPSIAAMGLVINGRAVSNGETVDIHITPTTSNHLLNQDHIHPVQISTTPSNSTQQINLLVGPGATGRIDVLNRSIAAGDSAQIRVLRNPATGLPFFNQQNDNYTITVSVGNIVATLRIFINFEPRPEMISMGLQRNIGIWQNIEERALPINEFIAAPQNFRFHATLNVLGVSVANTAAAFQIKELQQGNNAFTDINILTMHFPQGTLVPTSEDDPGINFRISFNIPNVGEIVAYWTLRMIE